MFCQAFGKQLLKRVFSGAMDATGAYWSLVALFDAHVIPTADALRSHVVRVAAAKVVADKIIAHAHMQTLSQTGG